MQAFCVHLRVSSSMSCLAYWGDGAGWWTFKRPEGNAFEGIPDDAFAARGNRGQYVVVVPSRDVVIVRRGEDPVGSRFDIAAFTRDVLTALED